MIRFVSVKFLALLCLFVLIISCKEDPKHEVPPTGSDSDRGLMLTNIADNIVIPAYASFELKLENMITKSDAFRANPTTTTLTDFRTSWETAYIEWQKIALFDFGPAADHGLTGFMNIYPTDTVTIKTNITSGNASLETPATYSAQGFPALDYLINGSVTTDADIVALYTTHPDALKRKAYLLQLTNQLRVKFDLVNNAWKGAYRNIFVASTGTGLYSSTALMVNGIVSYYERYLRSGKFAIPSGAITAGSLSPASVEAYHSKEIGKTLAQTAHQAFIDLFNGKGVTTGTDGASLKTYMNALNAKDVTTQVLLSETINTQFNVVNAKLALLTTEDLSNEVSNNNTTMIAVYNEMHKAARMLKVDMTSAASITITYTDNDGD